MPNKERWIFPPLRPLCDKCRKRVYDQYRSMAKKYKKDPTNK